jgi:hypothetical protein
MAVGGILYGHLGSFRGTFGYPAKMKRDASGLTESPVNHVDVYGLNGFVLGY